MEFEFESHFARETRQGREEIRFGEVVGEFQNQPVCVRRQALGILRLDPKCQGRVRSEALSELRRGVLISLPSIEEHTLEGQIGGGGCGSKFS